MLKNTTELYDHQLAALDGPIGHVKDFFFDDKAWTIRYVVADTGSWLHGRLVLLSPHAFGRMDPYEKTLHVNLNKRRIENSPPIESYQPVSRQYEADYHHYYGWPAYWNGGGIWGITGLGGSRAPLAADLPPSHRPADRHLQSAQAVTGYSIQTVDGSIGSVTGFLIDDKCWMIRQVVVEIGHWYSSKEVAIAPENIESVSYEESTVFVNLTKLEILQAAPLNPSWAGTRRLSRENFPE